MSRSAMKMKRMSRNSAIIDDALRQVGTLKKLYLASHICTIHRTDVSRSEPFSEQKAISLINKYHKRRQAHCQGKLFEDRFTLEKSKSRGITPFRSWVAYKEIKHLFSHRGKPEYFALCIDSALSKHRYYEIYKCKSAAECNAFQDRIRQALEDPDKIIRDPNSIRTENVTEDQRVRSVANFEYQNEQPDARESVIVPSNKPWSSTYEIPVERPISPRPISQQVQYVVARSPSPIMYQRPPSPVITRAPVRVSSPVYTRVQMRAPSPVAVQNVYPVKQQNYSEVSTVYADPDGTQDVIFISFDSKRRAKASKTGPIYMYSSSSNRGYLPGRSGWGSTEQIDRSRLNAAPYIDIERSSSLPDFNIRPQEDNVVYAQPYVISSPTPEYRQPIKSYPSYEQPNTITVVKSQPTQRLYAAVPSPEPVYNNNYNNNYSSNYNNNYNNNYNYNYNNNNYNNNKSYINGDEDELSDLTYISFDPNKGAVISERGPVYMYRKNIRKTDTISPTNGTRVMNGYSGGYNY